MSLLKVLWIFEIFFEYLKEFIKCEMFGDKVLKLYVAGFINNFMWIYFRRRIIKNRGF